jgi:hypothetical protein
MRIACIGWGSLVWDPGSLRLRSEWYSDGPALSIEFARQSDRNRVTLVLVPGTPPIRTLWAILDVPDLTAAGEMLRIREGTSIQFIGSFPGRGALTDPVARSIGQWAARRQLGGAVWTALPAKWNSRIGEVPTSDQVIEFLRKQGSGSAAEEYVRRAPPQVRTPIRDRIETELGWTRCDTNPTA